METNESLEPVGAVNPMTRGEAAHGGGRQVEAKNVVKVVETVGAVNEKIEVEQEEQFTVEEYEEVDGIIYDLAERRWPGGEPLRMARAERLQLWRDIAEFVNQVAEDRVIQAELETGEEAKQQIIDVMKGEPFSAGLAKARDLAEREPDAAKRANLLSTIEDLEDQGWFEHDEGFFTSPAVRERIKREAELALAHMPKVPGFEFSFEGTIALGPDDEPHANLIATATSKYDSREAAVKAFAPAFREAIRAAEKEGAGAPPQDAYITGIEVRV